MARGINRLTGADLRRKKPGKYADGGGLWLQVTLASDGKTINRSWLFRYAVGGADHWMGLGSLHTISLSEARERARKCRQQRLDGINPIEARDAERAAKAAESAKLISFEECAGAYIAAHRNSWRSEKHAQQWPQSLSKYVFPVFGRLPVSTIDTPLVMKALQTMWQNAPETGSRLRGRIEAILDWAAVSGYRPSDSPNPARWSGHLEHLLAAPSKLKRVEHLAALPYRVVPTFMAELRKAETIAARALEFLIATVSRSGEIFGARWDEINFDGATWVIPGHRMKSNCEHRVPLPPRCIAILHEMRAVAQGDLIFPGHNGEKLPRWTFEDLLKKLGYRDITTHGFRSAFRDWCAEQTNYPREICEAALAHAIGNKVEAAYRRTDLLNRRRRLMEEWATFCERPVPTGATVTPLHKVNANA